MFPIPFFSSSPPLTSFCTRERVNWAWGGALTLCPLQVHSAGKWVQLCCLCMVWRIKINLISHNEPYPSPGLPTHAPSPGLSPCLRMKPKLRHLLCGISEKCWAVIFSSLRSSSLCIVWLSAYPLCLQSCIYPGSAVSLMMVGKCWLAGWALAGYGLKFWHGLHVRVAEGTLIKLCDYSPEVKMANVTWSCLFCC